jgi:hypothetical protein
MSALRKFYKFWVTLMTVAVVVQIGFAGYGAFSAADKASNGTLDEDAFTKSFDPHAALGTLIVIAGLVLLLLSFSTRGQRVKQSAVAFGLLVAQLILGWTGASVPWVLGLLHPINAFLILGLLGSITAAEWGRGPMHRSATPATAPPPAA